MSEQAYSQDEKTAAIAENSVCAIVVAYFPDEEFAARIRELLPQVTQIVVVNNTPEKSVTTCLRDRFQSETQIHLIENRANTGISAALNQGLEYALKGGHKWILTLDQDTQCYPDMVHTLLEVCRECRPGPAVVGGNYLDPRNKGPFVPTGEAKGFLEQKTVITSGCLVDAHLAKTIGGFRENYFIDQVDHEFCLRMRACGHKVVISRKPVMNHSVGTTGGARLPFLGVLPNHPPLRKYYIARNTLATVSDYWRQEPAWCLRRLVRLLLGLGLMALLEKDRFDKVRAFAGGIADGLNRRMGPCARDSITRSRTNTL